MRNLSRALIGVAVLGLLAIPRLAAASWYVSGVGGTMYFADSLRAQNHVPLPLEDGSYFGARVGWQLRPRWAVQAVGGWSSTQIDNTAGTGGEDVKVKHYAGDILFSPFAWDRADLFLNVGGGWIQHKPDNTDERSGSTLDYGGGLRFWFSDWLGLTFEARNILLLEKQGSESHLNDLALAGGLTFGFGRKGADTDGDGVPDKEDQCANTPHGALVDVRGCPTDADGDGVYDGLDKCASTPRGATVDSSGCPKDTDGDGVLDGIDQCADTPAGATVDARGCPVDSDADGVPDGIDQCANTPSGAHVDARGCPIDSDSDGVPDGIDQCPDTPAGTVVTPTGCSQSVAEKTAELKSTGMIRLGNINFATGKATLTPDSYPVLDDVAQVLRSYPQLQIEIGGHTDSKGSASSNQKLSQKRAQAVHDYLVSKGLPDAQLSAKGYGESKPIAPNKTASDMAKNRRVEFKVLNKEALDQK